jgi:hypothetical protein
LAAGQVQQPQCRTGQHEPAEHAVPQPNRNSCLKLLEVQVTIDVGTPDPDAARIDALGGGAQNETTKDVSSDPPSLALGDLVQLRQPGRAQGRTAGLP